MSGLRDRSKACQVPSFHISFILSWSMDVGVIFMDELVEA